VRELPVMTDGFPAWIIVTHFLNIVFLSLMARSGIEVLSAFPKLYWITSCYPGREWLRLSRKVYAADSATPWSSSDEEESWSSVVALPGRKNLGLGRHWHLLTVPFWALTGAVYIALLFASGYWRTLVPTSWSIVPDAVRDIGTYLHFQFPPLQPGKPFNAAQQLAYFLVVFVLAPLQIATGAAMSPAVIGRFPWYAKLFGGRQAARSLHFLGMCAFGVFVVIHTAMVVVHGLAHELAGIVLGSYHADQTLAVVIGVAGIAAVTVLNLFLSGLSLRYPRKTQRLLGSIVDPLERSLSTAAPSRQAYPTSAVSAFHRANGLPPTQPEYRRMLDDQFADYRLTIGGLVTDSASLSLTDLRQLGWRTQTTLHNCIQGWSAVAQWAGVPLSAVLDHVGVADEARYVVVWGWDDKAAKDGGESITPYYSTIPMILARHRETILALEMNGHPLPPEHGAPLRLRVESQLGFKMVKWVRALELVSSYRDIGEGQGGWREDHQYYTTWAAI
jgi:DMSO/TMAO reductase YedYZ molybdopterin-dependent catalytic subunit/thiosulfate reductase cytochrome b subunit